MKIVGVVLGVLCAGVVGAAAQAPRLPDLPAPTARGAIIPQAVLVERSIGRWELTTPVGDRRCAITHEATKIQNGYPVKFEAACRELFPATRDVVAWSIGRTGHVIWLNGGGKTVFDFAETDIGVHESLRGGDATVYFLTNIELAGTTHPTPADIAGAWSLGRAGQNGGCDIQLDNDVFGGGANPMEERLAVQPAGPCAAPFEASRPVAWKIEKELLVLFGSADQVQVFRQEGSGWAKVPADRPPVLLTRR